MKRASYREAIQWIALNDDAGSADALNASVVAGLVSSVLVADIFGVSDERVGRDVVRARKAAAKGAILMARRAPAPEAPKPDGSQ